MDEQVGAQYALKIALHTLKERCQAFQHRISILEEENLNLLTQCNKNEAQKNPADEVQSLKQQIVVLNEQKEQLQNKIKIVSTENKELWTELSKLTNINKNLGTHLSNINNTLKQHTQHSPLIRSKTFTQTEPQTKVLQKNLEDNKISLELEDISLKLKNAFAQEQSELESLLMEINEIQDTKDIITNSMGYSYEEEFDDNSLGQIESLLEHYKNMKQELAHQNENLKKGSKILEKLQDISCRICAKKKDLKFDAKSTSTEDLVNSNIPDEAVADFSKNTDSLDKICPMCSKQFDVSTPFNKFEEHVSLHFTSEDGFHVL